MFIIEIPLKVVLKVIIYHETHLNLTTQREVNTSGGHLLLDCELKYSTEIRARVLSNEFKCINFNKRNNIVIHW